MTKPEADRYAVEEVVTDRARYAVVRVDGTPAGRGQDHDRRLPDTPLASFDDAEIVCAFLNATSEEYTIMRTSRDWRVFGGRHDDPEPLSYSRRTDRLQDQMQVGPSAESLIARATQHARGYQKRLAAHAEKQQDLDQQQRRRTELATIRRAKEGPLATRALVDRIVAELEARRGAKLPDPDGPTDRARIQETLADEARDYLARLTGPPWYWARRGRRPSGRSASTWGTLWTPPGWTSTPPPSVPCPRSPTGRSRKRRRPRSGPPSPPSRTRRTTGPAPTLVPSVSWRASTSAAPSSADYATRHAPTRAITKLLTAERVRG